jgi:signal transduction histidine kinase
MSLRVGSWASAGRPYRVAAAVAAALVLFGGWTYLYLKSRAMDLAAANAALGALRELNDADSRWNDWLIGTRLAAVVERPGAAPPVTRATVDPTALRRAHANLAMQAFALQEPLPPAVLSGLQQALDEKAQAVTEYGAAAGAYAEAAAAYTYAAASFASFGAERASGAPPGTLREADRLREAVLAYLAQPARPTLEAAQGALAQFGRAAAEAPESARPAAEGLARAAAAAIEARAAEDRLFRAAYFASTGPRLASATRAVEQGLGNAIEETERYRWYLLVYSALVVLLAAWLALRLTATSRAIAGLNSRLREANERLEHRVEERTKELRDAMTQLKEQETLLIQSEKMSSLGQMVAGVAHEVNTPLAYVKSSLEAVAGGMPKVDAALAQTERLVELLRSEHADEATVARQFAAVDAALADIRGSGRLAELGSLVKDGLYGIGQIGELVTNLRNFARVDRSKVAEFDLNEGVAAALSIARNQLKRRTVRQHLGRIPKVSCSPSQINQVLLNLLTNAAQATDEDGGVIVVRTWQPDADHVAVDVGDNGHGIPPEVLPKIFDPFFTTKEVGKGTGLGLSICYKIAESHGGRIDVDSKVGLGTRFTLRLPVKSVALEQLAAA